MSVRSSSEVASIPEALALLGLDGPTDAEALTAAFRSAVKAARPDQAGGDEARFRQIIAAWTLLRNDRGLLALAAPEAPPPPRPVVVITPTQALEGGSALVGVGDGRALRVRVPAGLRSGEHLRLRGGASDGADLYLPVLIRSEDGLRALGDDLYMTWPTPPRLIEDGGRVEIETWAGPRSAWLVPGQETLRIRLQGLGLPARGRRACGHLFVTLEPSFDTPSAAEDLLVRFTRVWTPERLAA